MTHEHDLGLAHDLPTLLSRRRALTLLGGLAALTACSSRDAATPSAPASAASAAPARIPEETVGPFPANGSNGANVLNQAGVVRTDIRPSFGGPTGVADGLPLTMRLRVLDLAGGGAGYAGAAVYVWHCDRDGRYSLYEDPVTGENYLRGVQAADAEGWVTFTTSFPGAYDGRWPHVHFEVYPSLDAATSSGSKLRTSQLAFPPGACDEAYATPGYSRSAANLSGQSLESDGVFADGYSLQLATMSGAVNRGLTATLNVPV